MMNGRSFSFRCYLLFAAIVGYCRYSARRALGIQVGDPVTDYLSAVLAYPLCLAQLEAEVELGPIGADEADVELVNRGDKRV